MAMGALCLAALLAVAALLMGAGAHAQVQNCEEPCPPCGACVQTPCPSIGTCPASAPCTVITNVNSNSNSDDGGQSAGGIDVGVGSVKGADPNGSAAGGGGGGGTTQTCCVCSCHALVCPNVTCTTGPCNPNATVVTPTTTTGGGHKKELSNGQVWGIVGGVLAAIAILVTLCKYARFLANLFGRFFPRPEEPRLHRRAHCDRRRLRGTGAGATVTIDITVEPRSSAPASASVSATSSAPASPAVTIELSSTAAPPSPTSAPPLPPPPIMYGYGVPSIFPGPDQEQEQEEDPAGCVIM